MKASLLFENRGLKKLEAKTKLRKSLAFQEKKPGTKINLKVKLDGLEDLKTKKAIKHGNEKYITQNFETNHVVNDYAEDIVKYLIKRDVSKLFHIKINFNRSNCLLMNGYPVIQSHQDCAQRWWIE